MYPYRRYTPRFAADRPGFTYIELLISVALISLAMAATSGLFLASKGHMRNQAIQLETTQAARSVADMMVRDLRLGGACLPVTGDFISLEGDDNGHEDEIVTRTGLTRPDLSCIRAATPADTPMAGTTVPVETTEGFEVGMRAYIRHPNGTGEYFNITSVDSASNLLGRDTTFSIDYPQTSGVYGIDERHFYIDHFASTAPGVGDLPELMIKVGNNAAQSFAVGIEKLDVQYQLNRDCPPCDVVDLPADNSEWQIVEQVLLSITARSDRPRPDGTYYRRTIQVGVKPRNLIPR